MLFGHHKVMQPLPQQVLLGTQRHKEGTGEADMVQGCGQCPQQVDAPFNFTYIYSGGGSPSVYS